MSSPTETGKVGQKMSDPKSAVAAGANDAVPMSNSASLKKFYSDMLLIRRFEERRASFTAWA